MKKLVSTLSLVLTVCLFTARPLAAQGGGVIDWIHRLSGPSMLGPTGSFFWEREQFRIRVNVSGRLPVGFQDSTIDDDHNLNMLSLQPAVEIPICGGPFEVGLGIAGHRLGGDGHDPVYHLSFPLFGQLRVPVGTSGRWFFRFGAGTHYFLSFDEEDFLGENEQPGIQVKTDGGEFVFGLILGLDYRR